MNSSNNYCIHMNSDPEFSPVISSLSLLVDEIIETGTNLGDGSTLVLAGSGKPVITLECNADYLAKAKENLAGFPNVQCVHGYSLFLDEMLSFIAQDDKGRRLIRLGKVNSDVCSEQTTQFYSKEIGNYDIPENLLPDLIDNPKKQLILLDSAGGIGWLEFIVVMRLKKEYLENKILVMDDINHLKHSRSVKFLEEKYPGRLHKAKSLRWGWINFSEEYDAA